MVQPIWHPPEDETDAFTAAVLDAIRYRLPTHFGSQSTEPIQLGEDRSTLPDGTPVVVRSVAQLSQGDEWYGRPTVRYELGGNAARRDAARAFAGHALVDAETQAFLELDIRFRTTGEVSR
ncbi:hypothetical protein [Amorphus coralli]|uniref:hypothetical protein n=1 Tax=Amorphus coralli TaxID=340680 RepID=UPI0003762615|nr:hypothetical protein [Amorphus coralli]